MRYIISRAKREKYFSRSLKLNFTYRCSMVQGVECVEIKIQLI